MKRMQLIAAALCLIMITTVGAGVVAAKQAENPRHAGASSIYTYDVAATEAHGTGKLIINVDKHTFEFNGKGFTPSAMIELKAKAADSAEYKVFATGKATPSGNLHIAGTWTKGFASPEEAGFGVSVGESVAESGTVYYIPPNPTVTTPYYVFAASDGQTHLLTFRGTTPSPQDFGTGKIGALYYGSPTYILDLDNGKEFTSVELLAGYTDYAMEGNVIAFFDSEHVPIYLLDWGVTSANAPLYGLPEGTFYPFPSVTAIKFLSNGGSLAPAGYRHNVIIFEPIRYSGAYTIEPR